MHIGNRIRKRRQELGLPQRVLAQALGVTPQHISVIEQGKRAPSLSSLAKLADELGVTMDYLVTGRENSIIDSVVAIKADTQLSLESKNCLTFLVGELQKVNNHDSRERRTGAIPIV